MFKSPFLFLDYPKKSKSVENARICKLFAKCKSRTYLIAEEIARNFKNSPIERVLRISIGFYSRKRKLDHKQPVQLFNSIIAISSATTSILVTEKTLYSISTTYVLCYATSSVSETRVLVVADETANSQPTCFLNC